MKIDINKLAEHFAHTSFQVKWVHRFTREPGMRFNGYSEPFPGFVFPLSGKAEFVFNSAPYSLAPGNVVHGGARMQLDMRVIGNTKWEYLLVLYHVTGGASGKFSLPDIHFELQTGQNPRLAALLEQLYQTSSLPGGIYAFRTETLFRCVLDEMFISAHSQINCGTQELFEQITAYIREHYMNALTMNALAKQYNLNENRLSYIFRKYAGMGPGDYLITYRLSRAKDQILNSDFPVHKVAKSVGYTDPYHFSRLFKKQFGTSPSEFRKKFRNNAW
ncbi:MAG: AraC family transcriptional regulator [Peptococcaceae bacterium]|nr:AraC family transcriptional regulator [Peptococcaceae bacterium]